MRYVIIYTECEWNESYSYRTAVELKRKETDDFEEAIALFTLYSSTRDNVVVIDPEHKKVVCNYNSEGKIIFNKYLIDSALYINNNND